LDSPPDLVADPRLAGVRVVMVDDVVTTGITLEYAARAVERAGGLVVGGVVLAATPLGHSGKTM
jgi:adenine/guanine phosphoribosyltransferase-like PRPP-binding protein